MDFPKREKKKTKTKEGKLWAAHVDHLSFQHE